MTPTPHSFSCGQPLGPGVAHHGMRNCIHHKQAHVTSPRGERLPAQVADHLSDAADVMPAITGVSGCSALDDIELVNIFLGVVVPIPSCLVLSYVLANTPMESYGQGWSAWSSLSASHTGTTHGPRTGKVAISASASSFAGCASPCATRASSALDQRYAFVVRCVRRDFCACTKLCGARRMNVHARRTPEMRRARWTNARHTRGTRGAHAGHALCVRRLSSNTPVTLYRDYTELARRWEISQSAAGSPKNAENRCILFSIFTPWICHGVPTAIVAFLR